MSKAKKAKMTLRKGQLVMTEFCILRKRGRKWEVWSTFKSEQQMQRCLKRDYRWDEDDEINFRPGVMTVRAL